jgi:biotin carboxyl carrier protein
VQYQVEVNGRIRQVSLARDERDRGRFLVSVDGGQTRRVDAARLDGRTLSLIVEPGAVYDAAIVPDAVTGLRRIRVGTSDCLVSMNPGRRRGRLDEDGHSGSAPQRLVAPMPGKIVRVAVAKGDAVRARQTVVVVEAMKMENELRAGRDGTIAELHAREGAPVDAGELLAIIQ